MAVEWVMHSFGSHDYGLTSETTDMRDCVRFSVSASMTPTDMAKQGERRRFFICSDTEGVAEAC